MLPKKIFPSEYISISDMYLAYRKAKSDAYYDRLHPSAQSFAVFESSLQANLEKLYKIITDGEHPWWDDQEFIGDYLYVPKSIDDTSWDGLERAHYRSVDPVTDWEQRFQESGKARLKSKYRLIIAATAEYQVLSALWILKVGHKFERRLDKNLSYGNRLRRQKHEFEEFGFNGPVNKDSLGLFSPYFSAYRTWRQKGLDAMRSLVESGHPATAITMDLAGFYHNVSPSFILKPSFLKAIGVELDDYDKRFTQLLLNSISCWYSQTPDYSEREEGALPVGLSASKIISNILLFELDTQIETALSPAYYGRYVDDIFLVFQTPDDAQGGDEVLSYLSNSVECIKLNKSKGQAPDLRIRFGYAADSDLRFTASKQKIFSLSSEHGLDLINQISSQIREQSSEYRMLPDVPESAVEMADKALLASPDASLIPDALRKADVVSVRRLGLSLLLRDIENYSTDLARENWATVRSEFYGLVDRYLVTPKGLFELFGYYPRVFQLMISNYDFDQAIELIEKLEGCFLLLDKTTAREAGNKKKIFLCKSYFSKILFQTALQASTTRNFDQWASLRLCIKRLHQLSESDARIPTKRTLQKLSEQLLFSDLGTRPYKDYWYYNQLEDVQKVGVPRSRQVRKVLRLASIRKFRERAKLKIPHWPALAFPTRALSIQEIALICPAVMDDMLLFKRSIWGLRGAKTRRSVGVIRSVEGDGCHIDVPRKKRDKVLVALTSFETTDEQFTKALKGKPDRSLERYKKINRITNEILAASPKVDYVAFPECSLPRRWAIKIAGKLASQGISLIAGIEYYEHAKGKRVLRNDSMVSLATRWPGYPSNFLFMQPKLRPSHKEGYLLKRSGKRQYIPRAPSELLPIYSHGDYYFGVLICSDLTTPDNRVRYQGKVDSLFVLEWNPDVKTFSFLIEGAAHDVHTFVVQVNNRRYGDSRIRAPYRKDYKRDSVRIKGGLADYFVIGEIDYRALRKFQKKRTLPSKTSEFKPVPIGFEMSPSRKNVK